MKKSHGEKTVGPWAREKLDALEKYLNFYCSVLKNQNFKLVYIDGFAGAPITSVRKTPDNEQSLESWARAGIEDFDDRVEYVMGSPIRALSINPGFDRHFFFDIDKDRVAELKALKANWPTKWIHVEEGDANERIRKLMQQIGNRRDVRGVAFLDPYGPDLEWQTVSEIAASGRFEVFINLPIHMAINRLIARNGERNPEFEKWIDACFGTGDWREVVYPETNTLFGTREGFKATGTPDILLRLYVDRLGKIFKCVAPPRLIRDSKNRPLYYIIWAGPHSKGQQGAEYVLGHGEKLAKKRRL